MSSVFLSLLQSIPHTELRLPSNTLLFQRADPVQKVYAIKSGQVHLLRRQQDGAVFILQRANPGALLAEASLMSEAYHCAAETVAPSTLTIWPRNAVRDMINQDKDVALAYAHHLSQEVRTARLRAEITSLRLVRDRLDAWLVWNGNTLPDKGARHHLAQEINVTPEALYREIARRQKAEL